MMQRMPDPRRMDPLPGVEELQRAVREWIDRDHEGNQRSAAKALGVSQGQLSQVLSSGMAAGARTLRKFARIAPREVALVMGLPLSAPEGAGPSTLLPNLERAIEMVEASVTPTAIAYARTMAAVWPGDRPLGEWVEEIEAYNAAEKRRDSSA